MGLFGSGAPRAARTARISSPLRVDASKNSLTASGERIRQRDADSMRRLIQPWQSRSFAYYDLLPEIKYAAQFYSRALSVLRLFPAEIDDNGELVETTDKNVIDALERIQDPGGGRSSLLSTYGRLMFLAGEAYLFVTQDSETGLEQWEILSTDELRVTGSGYQRIKAPSMAAEQYKELGEDDYEVVDDTTAIAYRLWRRHPRFSSLADSTMQGVLDICEELVLLTQAVRSRARSRLAGSGILLVNGQALPVSTTEGGDDEDPNADPFIAELTEAMTLPIADEGAASAVVPLVVRVDHDGDVSEVMKHLQIVDPTQLYPETGLRREAIDRLAIGLDMPPEVLLGISDANHWTGWQIDEQTWKGHLQPIAQQLVDDLTAAFLRPTLRAGGIDDWQKYAIGYDASKVINHPDRGRDAKDLYDRRSIGKAALRDAVGFDEEDAPTEEELFEMIGVALRDGSLALFGIPSLKPGGIEPGPGEVEQGDRGQTVEAPGDSSSSTEKKPPPKPTQTDETGEQGEIVAALASANGSAAAAARIVGASDLALQRARELAGNRLKGLAKRDKETQALIEGVPARLIASTLGYERVRALKAPAERQLVAGGRDSLADALRLYGIDEAQVEPLIDRIEQHAARTLYEEHPPALPPSYANYVVGMLRAAA